MELRSLNKSKWHYTPTYGTTRTLRPSSTSFPGSRSWFYNGLLLLWTELGPCKHVAVSSHHALWSQHFNEWTWSTFQYFFSCTTALYHACFICGQRCKWWSQRPKLTSSVISDFKPILYSFFFFTFYTMNSGPPQHYVWWPSFIIKWFVYNLLVWRPEGTLQMSTLW